MRWPAWLLLGFVGVLIRAGIGKDPDRARDAHRAAARSAGYLTGCYWYLEPQVSPELQAQLLPAAPRLRDDELGAWLDVEAPGLTEDHVRRFISEWRRLTDRSLGIYTSANSWHRIVGRGPRDWAADLALWVAAYPHDRSDFDAQGNWQGQLMDPAAVALRSNPPASQPPLPDPWRGRGHRYHQHTGHGRLPNYGRDLDLNVFVGSEAELRAMFAPGTETPLPAGLSEGERRAVAGAVATIEDAAGDLAGLLEGG